jgi:hypothetical protein
MLSLAIGREGQNARLAARLTGWRIDIRSDNPSAEPRPRPETRGADTHAADLPADPEVEAAPAPAAEPAEAAVTEAAPAEAAPAEAAPAEAAIGDTAVAEVPPGGDAPGAPVEEPAAAPAKKPARPRKKAVAADEEVSS